MEFADKTVNLHQLLREIAVINLPGMGSVHRLSRRYEASSGKWIAASPYILIVFDEDSATATQVDQLRQTVTDHTVEPDPVTVAKLAVRASAQAKLAALGLTEAEIATLTR